MRCQREIVRGRASRALSRSQSARRQRVRISLRCVETVALIPFTGFYEELMKDETYDKEKKKVKMSDTTSSRMDDAPQRITHDRSTTAPSNSVDTHAEIEIPVKEEEEEASLTAASDDVITMVCYRPINRELEEELPRAETMEVGGEDEDEELELELQEAEEQVRLEQAQLRSIQLKRKLAERKKKRAA